MAPEIPQVEDKRPKFLRVLPKNTQSRILAAIALVMVLIILFSGRQSTPTRTTTAPVVAAPPTDPNLARIQAYRHDIDEQAQKLAEEEVRLSQAKQSFGSTAHAGQSPEPMLRSEAAVTRTVGTSQTGIEADREKREYLSLFATNVVVSYRATPPAAAPVPNSEQPSSSTEKHQADGPQPGEYRILEGTILETVLTNRLDSTFSGPVNCMVTTNVYSEDRQSLLIPQGSRVLGEVRRLESTGDQRLAVFFHRIILPNGRSVNLDRFQGLSQIGETGLRDLVNHHYVQVFGVSIALGAIAGLAQANTRYSGFDESSAQTYEQGVSSSLSQSATHILDRYLNVLPTFTIREGQRIKVYLSQDLMVPAYSQLN